MKALGSGKDLSEKHARSLHEGVLIPLLMYECETQVYIGQGRFKIGAAEMDNLDCTVGGMEWLKNDVRSLYRMKKPLETCNGGGILR